MQELLAQFLFQFSKSSPLFVLIAIGYALSRWGGCQKSASSAITKFAFNVSLTAMLFRLLAKSNMHADPLLLVAFFGSALLLIFISWFIASRILRIRSVGALIFGVASVYSNSSLLGLPLSVVMLGEAYMPSVTSVVSFNNLVLWTVASILVELSRKNQCSCWSAFGHGLMNILRNPLILSIIAGALWNLTHIELPTIIDEPLRLLGNSATPLALIAVGMGLAEYGFDRGLGRSLVLSLIKLTAFPLLVYAVAHGLGLGQIETTAIVFMATLPCAANAYLMAREFHAIGPEIANAMLITTLSAAFTMPFVVTLLKAGL